MTTESNPDKTGFFIIEELSTPDVEAAYKKARAESKKFIEDLKKSEKINDDVLKIRIDV